MYTLLNERSAPARGIVSFPEFTYVKNGLARNLETTVRYYRQNPKAVASDHLLVRLLQSISTPFGEDVIIYKDRVTDVAFDLAMSLGMTSSLSTGKAFDGVFYGSGTSEVLIATFEDFDVSQVMGNWQNLRPVRVMRHPRTDLTMVIPNGQANSSESGIAVILINIPMLACQYRQFVLTDALLNKDTRFSTNQFVHMFVLPNMMYSHLDVALQNRIYALFREWHVSDSAGGTAFAVPNYQPNIDPILQRQILNALRQMTYDFPNLLRGFPAITEASLLDVNRLPQMPLTRQVTWALTLARIPVFELLLQINWYSRNSNNQMYLNRIKRSLQELRNDAALRGGLSIGLYRELLTELKDEIEAYL